MFLLNCIQVQSHFLVQGVEPGNKAMDYLPTVMSKLVDVKPLGWTYITPESGSTVALQVYVSEAVASIEGIYSVIMYTPSEAFTMVLFLPARPWRFPVTTTSLSTAGSGSSWMVQVRVRGSPWRRVTLASGSRLIDNVGGGTVEVCAPCYIIATIPNSYRKRYISPYFVQ